MSVCAILLAAGRGVRFGGDKVSTLVGRRAVWRYSYEVLNAHPAVDSLVIVHGPDNREQFEGFAADALVAGGVSRQESVRLGLEACPSCEWALIHDAARPFVSPTLVDRVLARKGHADAVAPANPAVDTLRKAEPGFPLLDRDLVLAMQTPQLVRRELLARVLADAERQFTDDLSAVQAVGGTVELVPGEANNFKITTREDLARARALLGGPETRTGIGYDIHPFSDDPARVLFLGGVAFEGHPALAGHSDADVLLHAVTDALLGAVGAGDIGQHFPDTDARWRGAPSLGFLEEAVRIAGREGWRVVHLDATLIAETPRVMKRAEEIRTRIAEVCGIEPDRVNLKATTNERLGAIGRSEGIAALATATVTERT